MRIIKVEKPVYEPGDLLDVRKVHIDGEGRPNSSKAKAWYKTNCVMVIGIAESASGMRYYSITQDGKSVAILERDLGEEKYIGHIDLNDFINYLSEKNDEPL